MSIGPLAGHRALVRVLVALVALVLVMPSAVALGLDTRSVQRLVLSDPQAGRPPAGSSLSAVQYWRVARGRGLPDGVVRVAVGEPTTGAEPVADVLFVHGHSDRLDNHEQTFGVWRAAGLRVVSFDLPGHGGTAAGSLDSWTWRDLGHLIEQVERVTRQDRRRPMVLAGFSLGGELVVHTVVTPDLLAALGRRPVAVTVFSPALAVAPFTAGDGISRARALVQPGGEAGAPPSPAIPAANPVFAARLLLRGLQDRQQPFPGDIPLLVVTADPEQDQYVQVGRITSWARGLAASDRLVTLVTCTGARHAVDNEAWPVGPLARRASVDFLAEALPDVRVAPQAGEPLPRDRCRTVLDARDNPRMGEVMTATGTTDG